jgi:AraC family transcriptional regulator
MPVDIATLRPESVALSSRPLGWQALNFERREVGPSSRDLPNGASEHLVFVSLGGGRLTRESKGEVVHHELTPGYVAVLPSGHPVRWSWDTRISFSVLSLDPVFVERVAQQSFGLPKEDVELVFAERMQDPAISTMVGALAREAVRGDSGSRVYADALANILAVHLLRNYSKHPVGSPGRESAAETPRAVSRAIAYIQENYSRDVALADIAEAAHLSPFHLTRLFKRTTGVAPYHYLIQLRVNSARALLVAGAGRRSLAEIASAVGFSDQSHLTRHFKRLLRVTPGQVMNGSLPAQPLAA